MNKNLVLTGMMGVGKSTIGKKLAKNLKFKFIDIDQVIEKRERKKINEIFKDKGESYFRKVEEKITLEFLSRKKLVISLGGGSFLNKSVRRDVLAGSISIWLDSSVKSILKRLKNIKKRPLLDKDNLEQSINKIYSVRKKIYNRSNYRVKCDLLEEEKIIKKIVKLYENSKN